MDRLPTVLVGIPSRGILPSAFVQSRDKALIGNGELFRGQYLYADWNVTDAARNLFVETALENEFDYIFMMDSDMSFPPGCLARMLRSMARIEEEMPPVLGGIYCSRSNDHRWHVYEWVEDVDGWQNIKFPLNSGLHKVDAIGTGCMLIDVNVFRILEWPWFEYRYQLFQGKHDRLSEDMVFCRKCQEAGIPMYADSDIQCGHFHSVQIWPVENGGYEVKTLNGEVY